MTKPSVRCRCGHCVLRNEVLRTEVWEHGRAHDTVYVRYRCRRCKRLGEAFIPHDAWDWSLLDPAHNELSPDERDRFADQAPISGGDLLDFHRLLREDALPDWKTSSAARDKPSEKPASERRRERPDTPERARRRGDNSGRERPDAPPEPPKA